MPMCFLFSPAGNKEELKKAVHAYADPQGDATLFLQDDEGLQNQHSLSIPPVLLQGSKIKILNWSSSRHINKALIMGTNPARLASACYWMCHCQQAMSQACMSSNSNGTWRFKRCWASAISMMSRMVSCLHTIIHGQR
ncbi:TPA: hypothetical protein ACH3X3_012572 [Trebouxia sp. C0006]